MPRCRRCKNMSAGVRRDAARRMVMVTMDAADTGSWVCPAAGTSTRVSILEGKNRMKQWPVWPLSSPMRSECYLAIRALQKPPRRLLAQDTDPIGNHHESTFLFRASPRRPHAALYGARHPNRFDRSYKCHLAFARRAASVFPDQRRPYASDHVADTGLP